MLHWRHCCKNDPQCPADKSIKLFNNRHFLPHLKALSVKLDYVLRYLVPQINSKLYSMFLIIPVVVVVAMVLEENPCSLFLESEDQIRSP